MSAATDQSVWQKQLLASWQRRGALAWLLWPLSLIYGALVALRRHLYQSGWLVTQTLPVPVIVVGNVIAGGAGKTPVVIELVGHLQRRGLQVGVVSRGYGRRANGCLAVTRAFAVQDVGDEPALIHRRTGAPVVVGERRIEAAQTLLALHPQTQIIVSDDGLQHLALPRDLEIVVFNDRHIGNGFLLPAGPLREPWPRHPNVALVLHAGQSGSPDDFVLQRRLAEHAVRADGTRVALAALAGTPARPLMAVAAVAQPEVFFAMLRDCDVALARTLALPDHFDFARVNTSEFAGYQLICTEKDAVKLWSLQPDALAVPLVCELPAAFWAALDARLERLSLPHGHTTT